MKMKGILVVAGLWAAVAGANAQKGVDNGTSKIGRASCRERV